MPKRTWLKVSGEWKPLINIYMKQVGSWLPQVMSWANISDTWKECMEYNLLMDLDGNEYHEVTINGQSWIVENLKVTKYADGTSISTSDYSWPNGDIDNKDPYGALYERSVISNIANGGLVLFYRNGVEQTGWHIPTMMEWLTLRDYLGGADVAGGKLKETGTDHWLPSNVGATNETGFTAVAAGYKSGAYFAFTNSAEIWSSTWVDPYIAAISLLAGNDDFSQAYADEIVQFSVRCVKDL